LFDEFTPDTFHPKLYSLSSLAAEATMIGELHENHEAWLKHLKHVQSELIERLEHGIERTLCEPRQLGMLERLSKATSATEVVGIGRVLALEGFHERLEESVRGKLANYDIATASKKKEDADALLTSLATFAFRKGCSSDDTSCIADVLLRVEKRCGNGFWMLCQHRNRLLTASSPSEHRMIIPRQP
jgi:hypothetical protein